jgi:hypothetical protein
MKTFGKQNYRPLDISSHINVQNSGAAAERDVKRQYDERFHKSIATGRGSGCLLRCMRFAQFIDGSVDSCLSHAFGRPAFGPTRQSQTLFAISPDRSNAGSDLFGTSW